MLVNGCECSIVLKTAHREFDLPYCDETLREAVSLLNEEAAIEGDGVCRGLRKINGIGGCVVTPLTIETAPLLFYIAMGSAGKPIFISETRNLHKYHLNLLPTEDTEYFDLIQDRKNERKFFEGCQIIGFELRVIIGQLIKLKLDICSENPPRAYPYNDILNRKNEEKFYSDNVTYSINGQKYSNIYGITLVSKKQGGVKTEIWVKRSLQQKGDIPDVIEEINITAYLVKDKYESGKFGLFRITLKRLILICDETEVNTSGAVISPLRYYALEGVSVEVFTSGGELLN
jgi:hypothetical protein